MTSWSNKMQKDSYSVFHIYIWGFDDTKDSTTDRVFNQKFLRSCTIQPFSWKEPKHAPIILHAAHCRLLLAKQDTKARFASPALLLHETCNESRRFDFSNYISIANATFQSCFVLNLDSKYGNAARKALWRTLFPSLIRLDLKLPLGMHGRYLKRFQSFKSHWFSCKLCFRRPFLGWHVHYI